MKCRNAFPSESRESVFKSAAFQSYSPPVNTSDSQQMNWTERKPGRVGGAGGGGGGGEINVLWLARESINEALAEQWRANGKGFKCFI